MSTNYTDKKKGAWQDDFAFIFYLFLKVHNADEAFLTNTNFTEKDGKKGNDLERLKEYLNLRVTDFRYLSTIIDYSFNWASTKEGHEFWLRLHESWRPIAEAFYDNIFGNKSDF